MLKYGERWLEGTFFRRARAMGNDIGYDSIVGRRQARHHAALDRELRPDHARASWCCSTWASRATTSTPPTSPAPCRSTAPSPTLQRELYDLVHDAQEAAHRGRAARRTVPRRRTRRRWRCWPRASTTGACCRCSLDEALSPDSKVYSRWTLHGVSHMLGMDVHDCGQAADEAYAKGTLAEGMVLTVEPGLYFQEDDLLVPEELRGIGIRIEDDILVTADGHRNLSASLPRTSARRRGVDGRPAAVGGSAGRQVDPEDGAVTRTGLRAHEPTVPLGDGPGERQPEPGALDVVGHEPDEGVEDPGQSGPAPGRGRCRGP